MLLFEYKILIYLLIVSTDDRDTRVFTCRFLILSSETYIR